MGQLKKLSWEDADWTTALFPTPSAIAVGYPAQGSAAARELVARAITLCRPRRAGHAMAPASREEIAALTADCRALGAPLPRAEASGDRLAEKDQAFDRFFSIARSPAPDAFLTGLVWGIVAMLTELGRPNSLVPAEADALTSGFYRMAARTAPAFARPAPAADSRPERLRKGSALDRWRNGHVVFVALTSGLILVHLEAVEALEREDVAAAGRAIADARSLLLASASALRLAGDMTPKSYDLVRAFMAPPLVPEGFSGLFDADHRVLLQATKRFGQLVAKDRPELSWTLEEYWLALNDTYAAHRWVCERLIGKSPSLIARGSNAADRPGHVTLEGFAKRALSFGGYPGEASTARG